MHRPTVTRGAGIRPNWLLATALGLGAITGWPVEREARGQPGPSGGPERAAPPPERLKERNALAWEVLRLREAGKTAEGVAAAEMMLAVERQIFGAGHEDLAGALEYAAGAHTVHADFEGARDRAREALAIREKVLGADHWLTIDGRYALDRLGPLTELDAGRRERYREGARLAIESNQFGRRTYEAGEQ